ncbi:MAG: aminodeoxychorismate synthase component I [Rhodocyclales bacterium]|nr:aminodeoxychorismate synthase component I [Rhodocyclales bacterium]
MLDQLEATPLWTVMALDYELGYLLEPKAAPAGWQPNGRALATFWRFGERQALSAAEAEAWLAAQAGPAGIVDCQPAISEKDYLFAVDRIKALISAGDCYQVNYTFPLDYAWFGSPLALYARLRARQPVSYGGFVGDAAGGLVSLSPELFLERRGQRLITRPMKGTAPRSAPAQTLRDSVKDCAENLMIVDLLRNDLGRVAENGSVKVDALFSIEDYPTVWQMVSEVSACVRDKGFAEILRALFPCGSITGAPKVRAMQIIGELEREARGIYTGALGWRAPDGDFRLNVAIRTLTLAADHRGRMGIGSGIVADSQGAAEWQECLLKASFLSACDPGILLIETLRREAGIYPRLEGHLTRLRHSAARLGFACDEAAVLAALAAQPGEGRWRVRLTLDKAGKVAVQSFPLGEEPPGPRLAWLATETIDADYPLRQLKTTDRAIYDRALQAIAAQPAVFDVVFLNQRGEVAEGARSNVFVERDGVLLTPPLNSGALPGVLRAELLASGQAREAVLYPADLAGGFYLGNALRGMVWVTLTEAAG